MNNFNAIVISELWSESQQHIQGHQSTYQTEPIGNYAEKLVKKITLLFGLNMALNLQNVSLTFWGPPFRSFIDMSFRCVVEVIVASFVHNLKRMRDSSGARLQFPFNVNFEQHSQVQIGGISSIWHRSQNGWLSSWRYSGAVYFFCVRLFARSFVYD